MTRNRHRRTLALFAALLVAGCAGFEPQPGPGEEAAGSYRPLTTPIVAMGDTQEHESTGYPLHDNDSTVDAYVRSRNARRNRRCSDVACLNGR